MARVNATGSGLVYGLTMAGADLFSAAYSIAADTAGNAIAGGYDGIVFKVSGSSGQPNQQGSRVVHQCQQGGGLPRRHA